MLKSIAAVAGSYILSIVLVLATDPLLSRLFPGDFVRGRVPSDTPLIASTACFVLISIFCAWLCARLAPGLTPQLLKQFEEGPQRSDPSRAWLISGLREKVARHYDALRQLQQLRAQ